MSRAPGLPVSVTLPLAPGKYDQADQREVRRLLEQAFRRPPDWNTVSAPGAVTALGGLVGAADMAPYFTDTSTMALASLTPFARTIIACATAAAVRTALGLGSAATFAATAFLQGASNLSDLASVSTARTNLGLGVLAQRQGVAVTTASLANSAAESSSSTMPSKSAALLTITADRSCRVRLYATQAARDGDTTRDANTKGTPGSGLLAEFVFAAAGTVPVSPVATLANDETVPAARVWYTITNTSGLTSTVTVSLSVLPLEI